MCLCVFCCVVCAVRVYGGVRGEWCAVCGGVDMFVDGVVVLSMCGVAHGCKLCIGVVWAWRGRVAWAVGVVMLLWVVCACGNVCGGVRWVVRCLWWLCAACGGVVCWYVLRLLFVGDC